MFCFLTAFLLCAQAEDEEVREVDLFFYDLTNNFLAAMNSVFRMESSRYRIKLNVFDACSDSYLQKKQLEATLDNDHDKLINLVDANMAFFCVEHAKEKKQKVIFFNRHVSPAVLRDYPMAWFVGTDESTSGQLQAKIIADYLIVNPQTDKNKDGRINTLLLRGEENTHATMQRSSNCLNALAGRMIDINLIGDYSASWSRRYARSYTETVIQKEGIDNIELIISNNDEMGLGAIDALEKYGYNTGTSAGGYVPVFGIDSVPEAIEAIREGKMTGTIRNDYEEIAKICMQLLIQDNTDTNSLKKLVKARIEDNGTILVPYKSVSVTD